MSVRAGKAKAMDDDYTQMGSYGTEELQDNEEDSMNSLSSIEPLSDESLAGLGRLSRYKPPPDPYGLIGRAAVLVALFGSRTGKNLNVLLSTRSMDLRTYAGQVALPGGKVDPTDINLEATARREAFEEVGLPYNTNTVRYLTTLRPVLARSMILVTPVVVFITDYSIKPMLNRSEVADIFAHPLAGFLTADPSHPCLTNHLPPAVLQGKEPYHTHNDWPWYEGRKQRFHSFETNRKPVTGLTAQILIEVAEIAYGRHPDYENEAPGGITREFLMENAVRDPKWKLLRGDPTKGKL